MPKLRDYLKSDLTIFTNVDEFATSHIINGKTMNVVVDNDLYMKQPQSLNNPDGYFPAELSYHVPAAVFGAKPKTNSAQSFDGKKYLVLDVTEDDGMYYISLQVSG